ncbi:hypothetical protein PG994_000464 [Apiospora phragmitis]|uniref:SAP domain-containing protein n=1 Tax=Apiospora phragmitis TaxID=2905665 RepID=A0ABR1X6H3_9PEZI
MATDYNKLKVVDLKAELKSRGLPTNGLKAELVARLEDAESGCTDNDDAEEVPTTTNEPEAVPTTQDGSNELKEVAVQSEPEDEAGVDDTVVEDAPDNAPPASEAPVANGDIAVAASKPSNSTVQDTEPLATQVDSAASSIQPEPSAVPSPTEALQDSQQRRRRSTTPAPDPDEVARKRAKNESGEEVSTAPVAEDLPIAKEEIIPQPEKNEIDMVDDNQNVVEEAATAKADAGQLHNDKLENNQGDSQNGQQGDVLMPDHQDLDQDRPYARSEQQSDTHMEDDQPKISAVDVERDVEPSIHPATAALYIKNFMRPLRPQQVQDHLVQLATSAGSDLDDQAIVGFYLDNIRTHSLVVFNTTSAASRVRTALHGTVWPEESTRKPLWVDYFPPEMFDEWVDTESAGRGGRGSFNRFEVIYDEDRDGNMMARLEEGGAAPPTANAPPSQTSERKMSIPTGPRGMSGIEGAPLGPRGFQSGGRGPPMQQSGRLDRMESQNTTRALPSITYMPVPEEVADRRLAAIADAKTKDYDRDFGKEYKRYFFERGDQLVDRGPEIFLGIRPPHRERERRRGGGGGGFGQDFGGGRPDGGRRRRGGGGGRRNNRDGPMPMPHGVPRGGDRYRGAASSGPAFDDRGGDRYRGNGYGRY